MPTMKRNSPSKSLSDVEVWRLAFFALKSHQYNVFFNYLELFRRRCILQVARQNYRITSDPDFFKISRKREGVSSPNADSFMRYMKYIHAEATRPKGDEEVIDWSEDAVKKIYILLQSCIDHVNLLIKTNIDPSLNFDERIRLLDKLIRYDLLRKALNNFLPNLSEDETICQEVMLERNSDELRSAILLERYPDLDEAQKNKILKHISEGLSLTLDGEFNQDFLRKLIAAMQNSTAVNKELAVDRIHDLLSKREKLVDQQVPAERLFHEESPYLGFVLNEQQVLAILQGEQTIELNREQLRSLLFAVNKKTRLTKLEHSNVQPKSISITPQLKDAIIRQFFGQDEESADVYQKLFPILFALKKKLRLSLDRERAELFLTELQAGIASRPAKQKDNNHIYISIDERDCRSIENLKEQRRQDPNPYTQNIDLNNSAPYLDFMLTEEQVYELIKADGQEACVLALTDEQVDEIFCNISKKCEGFSKDSYIDYSDPSDNFTKVIKNRRVEVSPILKTAMLKACLGLEDEALEKYIYIKRKELDECLSCRQQLDSFIDKTEMVTLEDLKNKSLTGLNCILSSLQRKDEEQWTVWKSQKLLRAKIEYIKQVQHSINFGEAGHNKENLLRQLRRLQSSRLLKTHRNHFYRIFKPQKKTATVSAIQMLVRECLDFEANCRQVYADQFGLDERHISLK